MAELSTLGAVIKTAYSAQANAFTDAKSTKLAGIESGATADQTAAEILAALLTVDGAGSGLDADLLDGNGPAAFATAAQGSTADSAVQPGSDAADLGSGVAADGHVLTADGIGGAAWEAVAGGVGGGYAVQFKSAPYTAVTGDRVYVDCSAGAVTITLPASPASGNEVWVIDSSGDAAVNNVTVARNGQTIDGAAANFVIDRNHGQVAAAFNGTTWAIAPMDGA